MRIVLITTTINVPEVLRLYRALRDDVHIIVAGDERTPSDEVRRLMASLGNGAYLDVDAQKRLGYRCSALIGWNTIARRNVAVLEAMRLRPDLIVTVDDDNIPIAPGYFEDVEVKFEKPFNGLCADTDRGWFNVGELLSPAVFHRGFPHELRVGSRTRMSGVVNATVGIAAGLWAGDPDIDATDRIVDRHQIFHWSEIIRHGLVVLPGCYAPFNSQNTTFRFDLAPLMMVWSGVGRYDDIWASYAAQRILRDGQYHVHFGSPVVWQQRNPQDQWKNLRDEILGMESTLEFTRALDATDVGAGTAVERLRRLFQGLRGCAFIPPVALEAGLAWCQDVEGLPIR